MTGLLQPWGIMPNSSMAASCRGGPGAQDEGGMLHSAPDTRGNRPRIASVRCTFRIDAFWRTYAVRGAKG